MERSSLWTDSRNSKILFSYRPRRLTAPSGALFFLRWRQNMSMLYGMVLGGIVLSIIGSGSAFLLEKKAPTPKAVIRDFLIGAVLVAFIMQLLPESSGSLLTSVMAMVPALPTLPGPEDMEVQVGVPKF